MLLICLWTDLRKQKIYNAVVLPVLFFGLVFNLFANGWPGLVHSLAGFLTGLSILIIPFAFGGVGAGDVKLLTVIGTIKGPLFIVYTTLGMALAGGIIALAILIYQRHLTGLVLRLARGLNIIMGSRFKVLAFDFNHEKTMFPYGLAIVAGAVGAFWWMG
jgi:prepilin peptidase CpaA